MPASRISLVEHFPAVVRTGSPTQRVREQVGARLWLRFSTSFAPAAELAAGEFEGCLVRMTDSARLFLRLRADGQGRVAPRASHLSRQRCDTGRLRRFAI